ncbi:MAG TPA: DNA mismatch repair protein MutT [Rhizobium sp.]|nr:DNA mismatch repair protein MutT [Rhizobium sp.]
MTEPRNRHVSVWPQENTVFPVSDLSLRVVAGEHPFHLAEYEAAAANWRLEVASIPALYDGRMVFQHQLEIEGGALRGEGHVVPYSTFLWWRKQPSPVTGYHLYGFPVIVSSDGAIIAVEMGAHTANAGQVYCAAGSLDESDIVDGYCDIRRNMAREVKEETGLDLGQGETDGRLFASHCRRRVTVFQIFRFRERASDLLRRIEDHMRVDEEKEIASAVAIRSPDPNAHRYAAAMSPLLDWFFAVER